MGSINISITEDAYNLLKSLKRGGQSFSDVIYSLIGEKDISKCFGLLGAYPDELERIREEAIRARKQRWKEARF